MNTMVVYIHLCLWQFAYRSMICQMRLLISMAEGCVPATAGCVVVRLMNQDL
jgi:hypothetical protein